MSSQCVERQRSRGETKDKHVVVCVRGRARVCFFFLNNIYIYTDVCVCSRVCYIMWDGSAPWRRRAAAFCLHPPSPPAVLVFFFPLLFSPLLFVYLFRFSSRRPRRNFSSILWKILARPPLRFSSRGL